ncbi:hypothetical protein [Caballeronia sp. NK8]|uniref:hypothetical protein n=1 Tax=Caballeronia sp. NK8 TaxID=140098 RepID=UPI001BD14B47|nr:hypothetical protein [Caballeronia sp. NK8]
MSIARSSAGPTSVSSSLRAAALRVQLTICLLAATGGSSVWADDQSIDAQDAPKAPKPTKASSPWLLLPTFSNNPKLGTSFGVLAGYVRKFDPQSQVSLFGVSGQYTSTNSLVGAIFARTSFDGDRHRVTFLAAGGIVKNDYDNFLGTGKPLNSEDHLRVLVGRYLYRIKGDWFIGAQTIFTNYQIVGQTALDDDLLSTLGLTGFKAGGVGLVINHDSRDIVDAPKRGWYFNVNSIAYRQSLEGSNNFNVYRADYRRFWSHGSGSVFALRQSNQWTVDAPPAAFAPVVLRGYTMGEYLGKYMSSVEVEERHRLAERWTATLFAGMACLYGASRGGCSSSANRFPNLGAGLQYILKPDQGIVANLEGALGKDGNKALLFKMGYAW